MRSLVTGSAGHPSSRRTRRALVARGYRWRGWLSLAARYTLLAILTLIFSLPFLWMVTAALKTDSEVLAFPPQWIPMPAEWDNFGRVIQAVPFLTFGWNSVEVSTLATLGQLASCSLAAYAFSRLRFPGRDVLFFILLSTLMLPYEATLIPIYLIMKQLHLVDTHLALYLPAYFGGAYGTFLLRQFFMSIPHELEDAAMIDGCNRWAIFLRIYLPLSRPALMTLAVFVFMNNWNNLLGPVVFLNSESQLTLSVGLTYFQGFYGSQWNLLMAGALLSVIPILVLYMFGQRYFVEGIALTGIKG